MDEFPFVHPLLRIEHSQEVLEQANRIIANQTARGYGKGFDLVYQEKVFEAVIKKISEATKLESAPCEPPAPSFPDPPLPLLPPGKKPKKPKRKAITPDDHRREHQTAVNKQVKDLLVRFGVSIPRYIGKFYMEQFSMSRRIGGKKRRHQDSCSSAELSEVESNIKVMHVMYDHFLAMTGRKGLEEFVAYMVKWVECHPFKIECGDTALMKKLDKELSRTCTTQN